MSLQSRDFNQELVRLHLEERGFLTTFSATCPVDCDQAVSQSRADHEIDVIAVRMVGGTVESALIGCIKGYWSPSSSLSPSMVRNLQRDKKTFARAFSDTRVNFAAGRFGLGSAPVKKVLFYSLRSPKKALEAESMLRIEGIEVVYLEDIIAEVMPRLGKEPYLASTTALQTLRALRGSDMFSARRKKEETASGDPPKPKRRRQKAPVDDPQLGLFAAPKE